MSKAGVMANTIKSLSSANLESPTKKRQLQIKSIPKNLGMLYQEKKMLMDMGLATDNVNEQIKKFYRNTSQSKHIIVALYIYLLSIYFITIPNNPPR